MRSVYAYTYKQEEKYPQPYSILRRAVFVLEACQELRG